MLRRVPDPTRSVIPKIEETLPAGNVPAVARRVLGGLVVLGAVAVAVASSPAQAADPDTVGVVDPTTAVWSLSDGGAGVATFTYGNPGDVPFVGDWDCDGDDTPGLYRQSDGFVYLRNSNSIGIADVEFFFGDPGDVPLAGDFDGDGCDTVSLYRRSEGRVYVVNRLGDGKGGLGPADFFYTFGDPGDDPFVGDFDNDGVDEVGLRRRSTGLAYLRLVHQFGPADVEFTYGDPGDLVVAGDWDGDGDDTVGLYRPSAAAFFLSKHNAAGVADQVVPFGRAGVLPVAGDFGALATTSSVALQTVADGLASPVFLDAPPGDSRVFVVERDGRILILGRQQPFLDIADRVGVAGEGGLLSMAFHPGFAANGRLFVYYTDKAGDSVVAEFTAAGDTADAASGRTVLTVGQPESHHVGGMIGFGPDGFLWIALGDGREPANGQDPTTLAGSLLRIDVDGAKPYAVPPGNPFAGGGGAAEVWAIGLRNPWRFAFDGGLVYVADVGEDGWEEVDVAAAATGAVNYGWSVMEGDECFDPPTGCSTAGLRRPVLVYGRADGCSIIGGYVYRGSALPQLAGHYFYGDLCSGILRSFRHSGGQAVDRRDWTAAVGGVPGIVSFGTDGFGELYVVQLGGRVAKLVPGG